MQRAAEGTTVAEVTSTYYSGCADMFTAAACRDAWKQAASAPFDQQMGIVATACRKAYCPDMAAFSLAICRDDFQPTQKAIEADWPPLLEAMVSREAQLYAADLSPGFLAVYVKATILRKEESTGAAPRSAGDAAAPPAGSAAALGSAAPPPSGSAAPAGSTAPSGSAAKAAKAPTPAPSAAAKPKAAPASSK
jgi:hypothetical protein